MREVGMGCGPPWYFLEEIRLGVVTLDEDALSPPVLSTGIRQYAMEAL